VTVALASLAGALVLFLVMPTPNFGIGDDTSKELEASIAGLEERLQQDPNDIDALLGLATVYQYSSETALAAQYLERVVAIDPSATDAYMRLAGLYLSYDLLEYESAKRVLLDLAALEPENPEVYLLLGTAQSELGESKAAILAWDKYLQLVPEGGISDAVREQIGALSSEPTTATSRLSSRGPGWSLRG
jgi:cytochrome c-type biogenesis protein CcmH/NrfG